LGLPCLIALWLVGCLAFGPAGPRPSSFSAPLDNRLIAEVPFIPDDSSHCGPSTLAAVMTFQGLPTTKEEVAAEVQREDLRGALGPDMVLYARRKGMEASFSSMTPEELVDHITRQKPVILLLESGFGPIRKGHFVTAVGYGPQGLVVNTGLIQQEIIPWSTLLTDWLRLGNFAILVEGLKPSTDAEPAVAPGNSPGQKTDGASPESLPGAGLNQTAYPAVAEGSLPKVDEALSAPALNQGPENAQPLRPVLWIQEPDLPTNLQGAELPAPYPTRQEPIINMTDPSRRQDEADPASGGAWERHSSDEASTGLSESHIGVPLTLPVAPLPEIQPVNGSPYGEAPFQGPATVPGARVPGAAPPESAGDSAVKTSGASPPQEPAEPEPVMGWER
jgi:hypothetical protein